MTQFRPGISRVCQLHNAASLRVRFDVSDTTAELGMAVSRGKAAQDGKIR